MSDTNTSLSNAFTIGAYWWLPQRPEAQVYGTLRYRPDSASILTLEGYLVSPGSALSGNYKKITIYGMTPGGKGCTLVDAYQMADRLNLPGIPTSEFFCNRLFIGNELIQPEADTFESAVVEFTNLSAWLSRHSFGIKVPKKGEKTWAITYEGPNIVSTLVKSIKASIKFAPSIRSGVKNQLRTLSHSDQVIFRAKTKQKLDWYLNVIFSFRIFLSLLIGQPVNPVSIKLCTKRRINKRLGNKYYRDYIDFCIPHYQSEEIKELHLPDILIPYLSIKRNFKKYLNSWYQKADSLKTTRQLLFGVLVQRNVPPDFQFLALIQAFESYHRSKSGGKYISDTRYEPIKKTIVGAIPATVTSDHRAALKSRIRYGNEYSLIKRFNIILKSMPANLRKRITRNDPKFTSKVVSTRNYLTHRDDSDKSLVLDPEGIIKASESLQLLLLILLLKEAGFDFLTLDKLISSKWRFRRILQ